MSEDAIVMLVCGIAIYIGLIGYSSCAYTILLKRLIIEEKQKNLVKIKLVFPIKFSSESLKLENWEATDE